MMDTDDHAPQPYPRRCVRLLLFLCWLVYTAGNVGRMNYAASMVAIIEQTGSPKSAAGIVSSCFFFAYGAGQLVNGLLCHKYNSRLMVFGSLLLAAVANICLPLCRTVSVMKWLWLGNGMVQSVLWSSLVKLQAEYLNERDINKSVLIMSTTTAGGTFIAYGLSALNVAFFSWQITFYLAGALLLASAAAWLYGVGYVQKNLPVYQPAGISPTAGGRGRMRAPFVFSLCLVCVFAVASGFVKDGVNTWTPNLLFEVYGIEAHYSILLTLILPLVSVFGAYVAKKAYQKLPNDVLLIGLFFVCGGGVTALILCLYAYTLGFTVAFFAVLSCLIAAVHNLVTAAIPFRLRSMGRSGRFAGIFNMFCYAGSTLSSILLGLLADGSGWNAVIVLLLGLLLGLGAVAMGFSVYWKKKIVPLVGVDMTEPKARRKS